MNETLNMNVKPLDLQLELENKDKEIAELNSKLAAMTADTNQFTYIVTHDLQAPLRMVTGFLDLLEKKYGEKLDDGAKQYIGYAVKGSVKMKNLVFDLLAYSRLNTPDLVMEEVDLNVVLQEIIEKNNVEIE